jgi:hypothetical protein
MHIMYGRIRVLKFIQECNCTPLNLLTFYVCWFTKQKHECYFKDISDVVWATLSKTWYGNELLARGDFNANEKHEMFYTPPQNPQKGELIELKALKEIWKSTTQFVIHL